MPDKSTKIMDEKDALRDWIRKLVDSEKAIVVEGVNDRQALAALGIMPERVFTLNRQALFDCVETLAEQHDEVIILTDLDGEGRMLYSKLKEGFEKNGVKVDRFFREFLFSTQLSHIEGIDSYFKKKLGNIPAISNQ